MRTTTSAIVVTVALAAAGCASGNPTPATPPASVVKMTPAPVPTGPALLGTTQHHISGDITIAVTALHIRTVRSHSDLVEPSSEYLGADVRVCVTQETKGAVSLSPEPWSIDYADDTETQPIDEWWDGEFSQPLYPTDRKAVTGQCVRGWIMFKPLKGKPVRVTYSPSQGDPVSWRIP